MASEGYAPFIQWALQVPDSPLIARALGGLYTTLYTDLWAFGGLAYLMNIHTYNVNIDMIS